MCHTVGAVWELLCSEPCHSKFSIQRVRVTLSVSYRNIYCLFFTTGRDFSSRGGTGTATTTVKTHHGTAVPVTGRIPPAAKVRNAVTFLYVAEFPQHLENLEKWEEIFQSGNFEHNAKARKFTQNTSKVEEF